MFSVLFIVVGFILLLYNMGYVAGPVWGIIWPSILIFAGVWSLFQKHNFVCKDCWSVGIKKGGKKGKK